MQRPRSLLFATVLVATSSAAALAATPTGWDGTWAGAWGGDPNQATTITITGNRVVSYTYQGMSHPVPASDVTPSMITYQVEGNTVRLIKRSDTTVNAALYTPFGNGTAVLTRR